MSYPAMSGPVICIRNWLTFKRAGHIHAHIIYEYIHRESVSVGSRRGAGRAVQTVRERYMALLANDQQGI